MVRRQLQQFICVAKNRNISKAAKELHMAQQTLSQSINALEAEIGVPLFNRTRHGVTLTDFGRKCLIRAEILFSQIEQFEAFVHDEAEKYLQKSVIYIDELPLVSVFSADIMYLASQLNIILETWMDTENGFHSAESNVCFCFRPVNLENNAYIPVVKEHPVVIVNKEHPLANRNDLRIRDILNEGLVLPRFRHSSYMSQLLRAYGKFDAYPICTYEGTEIRTLLDMVRAGVGIKISPSYVVRVFRMDGLKVLPLLTDELFIEYGFLVRDIDRLKATETQFINAMLDEHNTPWQVIRE